MKRLDIVVGAVLGCAAVWLFLSKEAGFEDHPTPYLIGALMIFVYVFAAWASRPRHYPVEVHQETGTVEDELRFYAVIVLVSLLRRRKRKLHQ
jgi:hypothetical protein